MRKNYLKLLMAPLSMLAIMACSPNQYQLSREYDDVYFSSEDRQKSPERVIADFNENIEENQVLTLENTSASIVDASVVEKYGNEKEVTYYEISDPKVRRAADLNYDNFLSDYENKLLAYYELPFDWETEWDEPSFNRLVRSDFYFALAWYDQYYKGDSQRMDEYLSGSMNRLNTSFGSFNGRPNLNVSLGFGFGRTFVPGFGLGSPVFFGAYDPFWNDPFFYDPFFFPGSAWVNAGWGFGFNRWNRFGWNRWNRWGNGFGWNRWNRWGNPVFVGNIYNFGNEGIVAGNSRNFTRGGRLRSTSVSSMRADAQNGTVRNTRSGRLNTSNSRITRSSVANVNGRSRLSGRSSTTSNRSGRISTNGSTRVRTDAYRFSNSRNRSTNSSLRNRSDRNSVSRANASRVSRFSRNGSTSNFNTRAGASSRRSGISFSRASSSRSASSLFRSGRGSSSRSSFGRSSGSRSSSGFSRGSSGGSSRGGSISSGSSRGGGSIGGGSRGGGATSGGSRGGSSGGSRGGSR